MLELKNIIELIVVELVDQMDEVKSGKIHENQKIELASYVLNRVQPMYITSNKGFTHIMLKYQNDPQFLADLMVKLNEGMNIIRKTKLSGPPAVKLNKGEAYYVFPRIYGRVVSSRTMHYVDDAKVTLYVGADVAKTQYSDWANPLTLTPESEGVFSFSPMPLPAAKPDETKVFELKILIHKEGHHYEKFIPFHALSIAYSGLEGDLAENFIQTEDIYVPF